MNNELEKLSEYELELKVRNKRLFMGLLIGMTLGILMLGIFNFIKTKEFSPLLAIAIVLIIIILYLLKSISKLVNEIKSRKTKETP